MSNRAGTVLQTLRAIFSQTSRLRDLEGTCTALRAELDNLVRTVAELEAALEWSQHEIKQLRGKVTGGIRKKGQPEDGEQPVDRTAELNALILAGRGIPKGGR